MPHRPLDLTEYWQQRSGPAVPPEYGLLVAILKRAALDYVDTRLPRHVRVDAQEFLLSRETGPWSCRWMFEIVFDEPQAIYSRFIKGLREHADALP